MGALIQFLVLSTVAVSVYSACDLGWATYKNRCLYFSNKQLYWNEAEAACEKMQSFLVTIDSEDKMNYIKKFMNVFLSFRFPHYWIGAKDAPIEGQWRWVETGSNIGSYSNWAPGQPDGDITQNCAMTSWNDTDIYWVDSRCESTHHNTHGGNYYICEKMTSP